MTQNINKTIIAINNNPITENFCGLDLAKCSAVRYSVVNGYNYNSNTDNNSVLRIDFYIAEKKIVIEVDGRQHLLPEHKEADEQRDAALATWEISVLRYSNDNIRNNFNAVAEDILKHLELDYSDLKPVR